MSEWKIRSERPDDVKAIHELTEQAFADVPFSDGSEPDIVDRLRNAGALAVSLICEIEGRPAGHIAFSKVSISDGSKGWYGLGPISVKPSLQRQGIGTALVRAGLEDLRQLDASGCVVLGDPGFYGRFGFQNDPRLALAGPAARFFQCIALAAKQPRGMVSYHPAFDG
ncbi:MAG TPA: N-acetyltransferase [Sphingomonadaceae bacterium]|nr:N-acetyltransferase [Sphingomonadaceae bacterium]